MAASALLLLLVASVASGQDLQSQLNTKKAKLSEAKEREGVLSTTIEKYNKVLDQVRGEVATLRNREAAVRGELRQKKLELRADKARLEVLATNLRRSKKVLSARLVQIYEQGEPDSLSLILNSDGFDDLVTRYDLLDRISDNDSAIADRVHDLRDEQRVTIDQVTSERDEIAARKAELVRTREQLESKEAELDAAQAKRAGLLDRVKESEERLEGDVSKIQEQIADQIAAAQGTDPLPAGPFQGDTSARFIWPVDGPVVSPFGPRTINGGYENHPGIDIAVPSGTPIRAAGNGKVIFTQPEASSGGYGNYTCIDHGGGLSTCYAHQASFAVSAGQVVKQGQVIGISDCTGYCFGPHLHFEVRINGAVTDPIPYLP